MYLASFSKNFDNPKLYLKSLVVSSCTSLFVSLHLSSPIKILQFTDLVHHSHHPHSGPTAMGRIPHFTNAIFPKPSLPFLSLVANIGLVLFLFIVGLEVDFKLMRKNWRAATGVGLIGLIVPFAVGAAVSRGLYDRFVDSEVVGFGNFLLFICVAFAITAFPVLCRILTELKMLQNHVGLSTLAAGSSCPHFFQSVFFCRSISSLNHFISCSSLRLTTQLVNHSQTRPRLT